jgi:Fungal Zn(2)-Cys(6) binuclear cluster domain
VLHWCTLHLSSSPMQQDGSPLWTVGDLASASVIDPNPSVSDLAQHNASPSALTTSKAQDEASNKIGKLDRACDWCRKRKTRCDGPSQPNNICSNCTQNHSPCTYV